ncbi:hypothetical protein [Corynebacterium liangguodongii]|uniref:hypothetical protein n=1 Tax=Corynebacterium liangguodongii TaxID=2079535 RepID=UPI001FCC1FC5|nr:hypothetical protein [Corynebacterium liangguodongii]
MTITARLSTPVVGRVGPLDGPLAWAAWQHAAAAGETLDPITDDQCPDFDLPLARWEQDGYWGWCVSNPIGEPVHHSAVEIRRRPASTAMAAYTQAREHHTGLGPLKARNVTLAATHYTTISWHATITDRARLDTLLGHITHLGGRHRNGYGRVAGWEVQPGPAGGWRKRPLPAEGGRVMRVRAPYWHPTERTACA